MRRGRVAVIVVVGLVLGVILAVVALWAMSGDDDAVSRPVAAAEPVAPAGADGQVFTPEAAAVAAAVQLYEDTAPTSPKWRETIASHVVGEADDIAAMIEAGDEAVVLLAESPTLADSVRTEAAGYRIVSYSDLDATVEVFRIDPTGRTFAVPVRVVWRDEAWRMVAPTGGTWWGQVREVEQ